MHLFELYEQLTRKRLEEVKPFTPVDSWPDEWKTVTGKRYERFPLCELPLPRATSEADLFFAIRSRKSGRAFSHTVTPKDLSDLLFYAAGEHAAESEKEVPRRVYPSAGGRYPLECYLMLFRNVDTLTKGVYHYDVGMHGLRDIRTKLPDENTLIRATAEPWVKNAAGMLIITGIPRRSSTKYGERAYPFLLLEAGSLMENFMLTGTALGIDTVSVGTFASSVVESALDIDGYNEIFIHALCFG